MLDRGAPLVRLPPYIVEAQVRITIYRWTMDVRGRLGSRISFALLGAQGKRNARPELHHLSNLPVVLPRLVGHALYRSDGAALELVQPNYWSSLRRITSIHVQKIHGSMANVLLSFYVYPIIIILFQLEISHSNLLSQKRQLKQKNTHIKIYLTFA